MGTGTVRSSTLLLTYILLMYNIFSRVLTSVLNAVNVTLKGGLVNELHLSYLYF
jgi:hypothetical protein